MKVRIASTVDGFRRCGIAHSMKSVTYPAGTFTKAQLEELENTPQLIVEVLKDEPAVNVDDIHAQVRQELEGAHALRVTELQSQIDELKTAHADEVAVLKARIVELEAAAKAPAPIEPEPENAEQEPEKEPASAKADKKGKA